MKKYIKTLNGKKIYNLGIGTWNMGDSVKERKEEIDSIKYAIDNGITLIDTAEMYGNGNSERLIGEAIKGYKRENLFIVSKVLPENAGKINIFNSCENSLKKLGTDYLDLYLLHWRGTVPLSETVECMEKLKKIQKIREWGVSNLDIDDIKKLMSIPDGKKCAVNQVLYHLGSRGIEYSLKPYTDLKNIITMAYCPLAQAGRLKKKLLTSHSVLKVSNKYDISPIQVLLCYMLNKENTVSIPKASKIEHMKELVNCLKINLEQEDIKLLEDEFPSPNKKMPLDME